MISVQCLRCKERSNTYDPLLDISLDIKVCTFLFLKTIICKTYAKVEDTRVLQLNCLQVLTLSFFFSFGGQVWWG